MKITMTLKGDKKLIASFRRMPASLHSAIKIKMYDLVLRLERKVKVDKLNGQVLNRISGRLARSINSDLKATRKLIQARVFSSGDVKYAGIHEYGGKTEPHEIVPNKTKALAFLYGGKKIFVSRVQHPGSQMPERSYLRSSLKEMTPTIISELKAAAVKDLKSNIK